MHCGKWLGRVRIGWNLIKYTLEWDMGMGTAGIGQVRRRRRTPAEGATGCTAPQRGTIREILEIHVLHMYSYTAVLRVLV